MWEQVELHELRVFLALSEHLHFGEASEQLRISHSRVSQILQGLEAKLGVRLFDRSSRRVTLTPAGARLRKRLARPYAELRAVLRETRARAEQVSGELRLGLLFPSSGGPGLQQIIDRFETRHPGANVTIRDLRFEDPFGPLRRGEIDLMACRLPINQPDLTVGPVLATDRRILALALDHPLAKRESISVEDLADCQAHDAGGKLPREYIDTLVPPRTPSGRRIPRRHIRTPSPTQMLAMVARNEVVHPTISSFPDHFRHPGVTFVPIRDMPPMNAGLVWRAASQTAAIRAFAHAATDTLRAPTPTTSIDDPGRPPHDSPGQQRSSQTQTRQARARKKIPGNPLGHVSVRSVLRPMSARWWIRQARAVADPAGPVAGRIMFEREAEQRVRRLRAAFADATRQRVRPTRSRVRALTLMPGGRLRWRSVPAPPPPGPLGAVVRPLAVATCDLDRPMGLGATPFLTPLRFGHECVAEVLTVGSDVRDCRPGQRVVVPFQISCGACAACSAGRTGNCETVPPISMYGFGVSGGHWGGAVADELAVPYADGMLVPLPPGIEPDAAASVADNIPDGYRHVAPHLPGLLAAGHPPRMIVVGAQSKRHLFTASVGLYAGLVARALGASEVTVIDARTDVRAQAEGLGLAAVTPKQARGLAPAPLVADISATPPGLLRALELTARDGICSSAGSLHALSRIPTASMFGRNATLIIARSHARALIPGVLALIADGKLAPQRVTTVLAPIDDAAAALNDHLRGGSTKTVVAV